MPFSDLIESNLNTIVEGKGSEASRDILEKADNASPKAIEIKKPSKDAVASIYRLQQTQHIEVLINGKPVDKITRVKRGVYEPAIEKGATIKITSKGKEYLAKMEA